MAKTYSWHPGNSGIAPRWAVPVSLLPDEVISSWLVRAALTQGCDPFVLTGEVWPKWRVWSLDIDRSIPEERLKPLSLISGISPEAFQLATLYPIASRIQLGQLPEKAIWPWILALGARNTKRRSGLQYCPVCLSEDTKPYYRLYWRFAWHTGCELHKCSLMDRCWNCNAPVEPHRLVAESEHEAVCATCKADLRNAIAEPCSTDALFFQLETDQVIRGNHGVYFGRPVSANDWFEVTHFFISLIRRANRSGADSLMSLMKNMNVVLPKELPTIAGAGIELLRVHDRQQIFVAIWRFLLANKDQLKDALKKSGITRQGLCDKDETIPAPLIDLVDALINKPITRTNQAKSCSPGPRPRHEVIRMMDRLKRKLENVRR
jgi:hypothetical protein